MKEKLINISHAMLIDLERAIVLADLLLEQENMSPEIYVPLHFIKESLQNINSQNEKLETILLNSF